MVFPLTRSLTVGTITAALLGTFAACSGGNEDPGSEPQAEPEAGVLVDGGTCEPPPAAPSEDVTLDADLLPSPSAYSDMGNGVLKLNDVVFQANGFGNTFMVTTSEGNVIIDTTLAPAAQSHKDSLQAIDDGPVRYVILTHAHPDHIGGVPLWKEEGTQVIAQQNHVEFVHYQRRLAGLFRHHNFAQFPNLVGGALPRYDAPDAEVVNEGGQVLADILFDSFYEFELGGLTFQLVHTPGETYDHLTVWIPEYRIAFTGDNFYGPFPNMYTLRGTKPRWALDYVHSIDRVLSWDPVIVAPSHLSPLYGQEIVDQMTRYRDAILYVHDETVRGMNAGKSVFTVMQEVTLPPELQVAEAYGTVRWTVRGIYEGYIGWFDGNASNMYSTPSSAAYPEIVEMAGGANAVAARAQAHVDAGELELGIRMADIALEAEPSNQAALRARLAALDAFEAASVNTNEVGWLGTAKKEVQAVLDSAP